MREEVLRVEEGRMRGAGQCCGTSCEVHLIKMSLSREIKRIS